MSIRRFAHKGVEEVFITRGSRRIAAQYHKRLVWILDALDAATCVQDLRNARGFHALSGDRSGSFAM